MTAPPTAPAGTPESLRTVLIALVANAGVAVAKLAAGLVTGSSAMISEAWHACADTGNQVILIVARRRSRRPPDDRHPLGHGREAYFWALLAAVGVFVAGGLLSLHQGYEELTAPTPATDYVVAYVVLLVALALESVSFVQAAGELRSEARRLDRRFLQHVQLSSEPTSRAVFAEDGAAIAGNLVAIVGVALHQITGSAVPDGIASLIIGLLLVWVGYQLAARNRDFLVGEAPPQELRRRCRRLIAGQPGVREVTDLLMVFTGPREIVLIAHVDVDERLDAVGVENLVNDTAARLRTELPLLARAEIVPSGRAGALGPVDPAEPV
jgi:cation diffusion facilitator family transporter